jgi:integrase
MSLTDKQIKAAKCPPSKKQKKIFDSNGLYLLIKETGSKLWRMKYMYASKHQEIAFGKYPNISLSEARQKRDEARKLLDDGINPMQVRKDRKKNNEQARVFRDVANLWFENQKRSWSEDYIRKVAKWISKDCQELTNLKMQEITASDISKVMRGVKERGNLSEASPILSVLNRVFQASEVEEPLKFNPAANFPLKEIIGRVPRVKHRASLTNVNELSGLIKDIDQNQSASYCTNQALKLLPRIFLRPGEIRKLKWDYVDFESNLITIPSEEMKMERSHIVPMARQVKSAFIELKRFTSYSPYVFPGERNSDNPISKNVITNLLRKLGYSADIVSAHGFRSTASTILNEEKGEADNFWDSECIEMQLSHLSGTASKRAYDHSYLIKKRRRMMQWWADFLDDLHNEEFVKGYVEV